MWNNFKKIPVMRKTGEDQAILDKAREDINTANTIEDIPSDNIEEDVLWYDTEIFSTRIIIVIVVAFIALIILAISFNKETSIERIERIRYEITIAQQENIILAQHELDKLSITKKQLLSRLSVVMNDEMIYTNCISLNTTWAVPVDCSSITLSLKQKLNWKVNSNWLSQEFKTLKAETKEDRMEELLDMYSTTKGTLDIWISLWDTYGIDPALAIAIAKADSSLWDELKTTNNIGNVGNNDRWDTRSFKSIEEWIEAIYKTLSNQYLWDIYTVGYLSEWWRRNVWAQSCSVSGVYCYASSPENWNINVINTLKLIYNDWMIDETYDFRTLY